MGSPQVLGLKHKTCETEYQLTFAYKVCSWQICQKTKPGFSAQLFVHIPRLLYVLKPFFFKSLLPKAAKSQMNLKKSIKTKMKSQSPPKTCSSSTEQKTTTKMVKMLREIKQDKKKSSKALLAFNGTLQQNKRPP